MERDPLSVFLHEKVGNEAPSTGSSAPKQVTKNPSATSFDPGERAMAGFFAVTGAVANKILPWAAKIPLKIFGNKDSVKWPRGAPVGGEATVRDSLNHLDAAIPRAKLMGLFDVSARRATANTEREFGERIHAANKLVEIQGVVDSFIDHHHLAEKGVKLNFKRSLLMSEPAYHIPTKQVNLPRVGKEQVLHELGHAADYTAGHIGRFRGIAEPIIRHGVSAALPIALIAGDRIKEMLPGTVDDHVINFMQNHAPEIMGATLAATQLYPEAKASFLAVRHIAKTEGPEAAHVALKKLVPMWGTYWIGAIPAVVGMALARKYMRAAREDKTRLGEKKEAGFVGRAWGFGKAVGQEAKTEMGSLGTHSTLDIGHVLAQIGQQTMSMIREPGVISKIHHAAKDVGTSPEFVHAALASALPGAMGALYLYGTPSGKVVRSRIHADHVDRLVTAHGGRTAPIIQHVHDRWREDHPKAFAGLVAAGAALSGGILARFMSDLQRVA